MSILFVYPVSSPELPNKVLTHIDDIASTLAEQGVHFERLPVATPIRPGTDAEQVLERSEERRSRCSRPVGHNSSR